MRNRQRVITALIAGFGAVFSTPALADPQAPSHSASNAHAAHPVSVTATITNLRSTKGKVLACLTTRRDAFPNCEKDPASFKLIVDAANTVTLNFPSVPAGNYAVSVIHDENSNGKLDTHIIIPREGYGFSNDAPVRMGPPKFAQAAFDVGTENVRLAIRMRYLL